MTYPKKYNLEHPWNVYYARARCQAKFRREEWAFTPETWMRMWRNSGVMQYRMTQAHGYCMARMDKLEAWGPHNCVIVPRRTQLKKTLKMGAHSPFHIDDRPFTEEDDVTPPDRQDRSFE